MVKVRHWPFFGPCLSKPLCSFSWKLTLSFLPL